MIEREGPSRRLDHSSRPGPRRHACSSLVGRVSVTIDGFKSFNNLARMQLQGRPGVRACVHDGWRRGPGAREPGAGRDTFCTVRQCPTAPCMGSAVSRASVGVGRSAQLHLHARASNARPARIDDACTVHLGPRRRSKTLTRVVVAHGRRERSRAARGRESRLWTVVWQMDRVRPAGGFKM